MENEALQLLEDQGNIQNFGYALLFLYSMGGGYLGIITAGVFSSLGKLHFCLLYTSDAADDPRTV